MSARNNTAEREKDQHGLNPFRYRGHYYDRETGFYYLKSRYYDPETGRFLNADGLISTGTGVAGYNMYAYCGNNPVNMADPTGTCGTCAYYYQQCHPKPYWTEGSAALVEWQKGYDREFDKKCSLQEEVGFPANYFVDDPNPNSPFPLNTEKVDKKIFIRLYMMGTAHGLTSIGIKEGFRTRENQQWLYDNRGNDALGIADNVARPGYGPHEFGNAVDISYCLLWDLPNSEFEKFGLSRPEYILGDAYKNEKWHIQLNN